ncbi:hypothetical protein BV898_18659 [Hypsibius exemplaris]|uniref:PPPDE domain-containing protein n=1 Tax=Hypsibius exemplaris TaxID=2072580 RepID=A0A9X6NKC9_HYPEX|nr:hypothetical protein BV898_18659 [Hypsibius exemplaris]
MDEDTPVKVHIYDLTKGMARQFSQMFIGKHLDGVWHTGVVAYGQEFFFGGQGIESCPPLLICVISFSMNEYQKEA